MFKVTEAEIAHNKRLRSGLIERIEYKPNSLYQVIVGPNGFGKSALLDEICAWPSTGGAFEKLGFSRLKMETDLGTVETKSTFESDGRHEFWLNGENLNDGGTAAVQRDLVQQHLNVSKLSYTIMGNQFSFSMAKPGARQEILTQLGDSDMSFAYAVFNRARKKLNHAIGAVGALEESLIEKETLNISEDEFAQLSERLKDYETRVTEVLIDYTPATPTDDRHLQQQWENFPRRVRSLLQQIPNAPLDAADRSQWVLKIAKVKERALSLETRQRVIQEEYDELDRILKRSSDASEDNLSKLREELSYWQAEHERRLAVPHFDPEFTIVAESVNQALNELNAAFGEWKTSLSDIKPDPENRFTRTNYDQLVTNRQRYREHYNALAAKKAQYEEQLAHLDNGKEVHCPNCKFHFIPGVSSDARPRLTKALEDLNASLLKGQTAIDDNQRQIDEVEEWFAQYKAIIGLMRICPTAAPFFERLQQHVDMKSEPLRAIHVAMLLKEDLGKMVDKQHAAAKVTEVESLLDQLSKNAVSGIDEIRERHRRIGLELEKLTSERLSVQQELREHETGMDLADRYTEKVEGAENEYQRMVDLTHRSILADFNRARELIIQDLQGHIGALTKTLTDAKTLRDQIADTKVQLAKQRKRVEGLKKLVQTLSPKSGIVAEQMNDFISVFIRQVNEVIADIWTYPMEILVGKPTDTELTYVFPIRLHDDNSYIVPDLKNASDGQKAIIDFAFQITAMLYMQLVNVPLLLDEVDRPLGPVHKANLMRFITSAVENGRFSQVFLISHHAVSHGALPFPDIIDFDFRNCETGSNQVASFS